MITSLETTLITTSSMEENCSTSMCNYRHSPEYISSLLYEVLLSNKLITQISVCLVSIVDGSYCSTMQLDTYFIALIPTVNHTFSYRTKLLVLHMCLYIPICLGYVHKQQLSSNFSN